ncbi:neuropeptide FF receptor 2-like [Branchiostoma floridae x Branchiostoma japonicum]
MDFNDSITNITNNITDDSAGLMDYMLKQTVPVITVLGISYFLTFASSIIGNILVILVVLKIPRMRTVTNYFILNLAVSDILVAVLCMPFTLVDNIIRGWIFGDVMCKLSPAVQVVSVSASLFTLVGIAFDRFFAIVHPTKQAINIRSTLYIIITVWASAICVMIPQVLLIEERAYIYEGIVVMHVCEETDKMWRKVYTLVLFVICYIGPLTIIMYLYARIGHKVWFKPSPGGGKASVEARMNEMKKKKRVIKMLLAVVVVFTLCWLPLHSITLLNDYGRLNPNQLDLVYIYIYPIAHWLIYLNSCVNPVIYGYFNRNFRAGFKSLVLGKSEGPLGDNVMTPNHAANGEQTTKHMRMVVIGSSRNINHTEV